MDERAISEWTPRRRYAEHGPAGMADVLRGVGLRLRWRRLVEQHQARLPLGFLALVNGVTSIGLMAVAAQLTHEPLVFPSLGPTAFLLFYTGPTPRCTVPATPSWVISWVHWRPRPPSPCSDCGATDQRCTA